MNTNRTQLKQGFINQQGFENAHIVQLPADASNRTYSRITTQDSSYLLMDSPIDKEPVDTFIKIDAHLIAQGFNAPAIIAKDEINGFLLLEDFGDDTFSHLLHNGGDAQSLYTLATDTLIAMHKNAMMTAVNAHPYDMGTYIREVNLLIEWLYPALMGEKVGGVEKSKWELAWITDIGAILPTRTTLVLRDFHAGNLMLVAGKTGIQSCGLLDFQDALIGHPSYDLVSLLEDVRLDIDTDIEQKCLAHYKSAMQCGEEFDTTYTILSAQRHAKVLGIFMRLYERDGKDKYLQYLPRTAYLFNKALSTGILPNVQTWFNHHMPEYADKLTDFLEKTPKS